MKTRTVVLILVIVLVAVGFYIINKPDVEVPNGNISDVPVMNEFPNKVVYTTNADANPTPFIDDCTNRGGEFNECGSICAPDADLCADVCAFTCSF